MFIDPRPDPFLAVRTGGHGLELKSRKSWSARPNRENEERHVVYKHRTPSGVKERLPDRVKSVTSEVTLNGLKSYDRFTRRTNVVRLLLILPALVPHYPEESHRTRRLPPQGITIAAYSAASACHHPCQSGGGSRRNEVFRKVFQARTGDRPGYS